MQNSKHRTQMYTLFGGAYVPENHGPGPALGEEAQRSQGKWAVVLVALLLGATTAAAAITATHRNNAPAPISWTQSPANFQMRIPNSFWFEDAVY